MDAGHHEKTERVKSLGYVGGSVPAPQAVNVTVHDPEHAFDGLNLYTSGHGGEATLMDMDGRVLHRWSYALHDAWPGLPEGRVHENFWRRVHLYPNGDLLVLWEGLGILKLDADSNLVWKTQNHAHHDFEVLPDGSIYVLTRRSRMVPRLHPERRILDDRVTRLDAEGREIHSFSILDALESRDWERLYADGSGDILHTNAIEVLGRELEGIHPAFRRGNLLLSVRTLGMIGVIDIETETFAWTATGAWRGQHQPVALHNGRILLFDNLGAGKQSRVMELDPRTLTAVWTYQGDAEHPFYTASSGLSARLPNGNTLITESDAGRAFEVTPDSEIVWEFYNPNRTGEKRELIATLFEVMRLPPDTPTDWAHPPALSKTSPLPAPAQ